MHAQESGAAQACAERLVTWATAVAAADQIHSSSEVQQAVIGACSSIRQPWPGLADTVAQAFAEAPVDRVRQVVIQMSCRAGASTHTHHALR